LTSACRGVKKETRQIDTRRRRTADAHHVVAHVPLVRGATSHAPMRESWIGFRGRVSGRCEGELGEQRAPGIRGGRGEEGVSFGDGSRKPPMRDYLREYHLGANGNFDLLGHGAFARKQCRLLPDARIRHAHLPTFDLLVLSKSLVAIVWSATRQ
jgi:hypothetical protein